MTSTRATRKTPSFFELFLRLIDSKHDLCLTHEMAYEPQFSISPLLLNLVEVVAALRDRIQSAAAELSWIPALQKDTRTRNVHASTAIEGNPLDAGAGQSTGRGARTASLRRAISARSSQLFCWSAFCRETRAQEDHSSQRSVSTAQTPGGWRDGSKGNRFAIAWFPCESATPFRRLLPMSSD